MKSLIFHFLLTTTFLFQGVERLNIKKLYEDRMSELKVIDKRQEKYLIQNNSFNGWDFFLTMPGNSNPKIKRRKYIDQFKNNHRIYSLQLDKKNFIVLVDDYQLSYYDKHKGIKLYFFNNYNLNSKANLIGKYEDVFAISSMETVSELTFHSTDSLVVKTASLTFSDIIDNDKITYYSDTIMTYFNFSNNQVVQLRSDTLKFSWEE